MGFGNGSFRRWLSGMKRILVIFGTRPEAIKLCPVILHLRRHTGFAVRTCATAQHRDLLDQVLHVFRIEPDHDLNLMLPGQSLAQSPPPEFWLRSSRCFSRKSRTWCWSRETPRLRSAAALAAFYRRIPVGHVEAGLRTGDLAQPFPEEMNRVVRPAFATLHFAATEGAAENLRREGVDPASVHVTGNSGIDAVLYVKAALESGELTAPAFGPIGPRPQTDRCDCASPREFRRGIRADLYGAWPRWRRGRTFISCCPCIPIRMCASLWRGSGRPRKRHPHRSAGICAVCGPDAAGLYPHYRFRRHSGRRSVAWQTGAGDAGKNRKAGSRRSRYREAGGHRSRVDSAGG